MSTQVMAARPADVRVERYRQAERALWRYYGLAPSERFVDVPYLNVRLRVLEIGFGEPVLFVHGLIGPGAWAPLVQQLRGFRCLVLDRPGWGLSSALDYRRHAYKVVIANVLDGVLKGLGIGRSHVIGGSIGALWALRLAAAYPSRVGRIGLVGSGPLLSGIRVPPILRMIASPLGALMVRRADPDMLRSMLRQSGHAASLADGRVPEEFLEWRVAASRDTDAMRSERDMLRHAIVRWTRPGWRPGLIFDDAELGAIAHPTLHVHGTSDPTGTIESAKRVVNLLPRGELDIVDAGGHEPWFEDVGQVARRVSRFLARQS